MCTLPIVWVAFSGVRKSLSPQGTGQVEVKENPPSPRLRRWQPKKLGDRFFVGKFWIYPLPLPRIASHQLEFFNFLFSGDPEKKTHFYLPLLFGWVGGGGGLIQCLDNFPLHQWLMSDFCWRPIIHHFHPSRWQSCINGIGSWIQCRSLSHLRLAQASRIWIDMARHTSTYTPEN